MPRRNIWILGLLIVVCLACYSRASRYGQVLTYAMRQIEQRHLEQVGEQELFEGALEGMMAQLKDPHSVYVRPRLLQEVEQEMAQKFGGLGIEVILDPQTKQLIVATPIFGAPAHEAGIRPGDRILAVDGRSMEGISLDEATALMRGEQGTAVTVRVLHEGEEKPVELRIVRAEIRTDTVVGYARLADGSWDCFLGDRDKIGYLRVSTFGERTDEELRQALQKMLDDGMKGLVLDLRYDPGGLLTSGVRVCDLFINSGVIVSMRGREGEVRQLFTATQEGTLPDFPMAVLVNGYSASASEIVAACLQDHGRAVIVGERTFGKGTVQEIVDLLPDQGAIKLTTASYWRPSQKNINRPLHAKDDDDGEWGVMPDPGYEVKLEGEPLAKLKRWRLEHDMYRSAKPPANGEKPQPQHQTDVDPQLAKAVEYLDKEIAERTKGVP